MKQKSKANTEAAALIQVTRTTSFFESLMAQNPSANLIDLLDKAVEETPVTRETSLIIFKLTMTMKWRHPILSRRFSVLRKQVKEDFLENGVDSFDSLKISELERLKSLLEYGANVDLQRLQFCAEDRKLKKRIRSALISLGSVVDEEGQIFAAPLNNLGIFFIYGTISFLAFFQVLCVLSFIFETQSTSCQNCVLWGSAIVFFLCFLAIDFFWELGPKRVQYSKMLLEIGFENFWKQPKSDWRKFWKFQFVGRRQNRPQKLFL